MVPHISHKILSLQRDLLPLETWALLLINRAWIQISNSALIGVASDPVLLPFQAICLHLALKVTDVVISLVGTRQTTASSSFKDIIHLAHSIMRTLQLPSFLRNLRSTEDSISNLAWDSLEEWHLLGFDLHQLQTCLNFHYNSPLLIDHHASLPLPSLTVSRSQTRGFTVSSRFRKGHRKTTSTIKVTLHFQRWLRRTRPKVKIR